MPIPASGGATKKADALFADHPQQPANVIALGTQHGMHRIARLPLEMTAIHARWVSLTNAQPNPHRFRYRRASNKAVTPSGERADGATGIG